MVVIGVIGKSIDSECNKMIGFDMVKIDSNRNPGPQNGQIHFYYDESNLKILYVHFQTTFDEMVMEQMLCDHMAALAAQKASDSGDGSNENNCQKPGDSMRSFHTHVRTKFAQMLLFAIQVCHIIVLVETNSVFDTSFLSIFKALKVIR